MFTERLLWPLTIIKRVEPATLKEDDKRRSYDVTMTLLLLFEVHLAVFEHFYVYSLAKVSAFFLFLFYLFLLSLRCMWIDANSSPQHGSPAGGKAPN